MPDLQTELNELFDRFQDGSYLERITSTVHKQLESWGISDQEIRVVSPLPPLGAVSADPAATIWRIAIGTPEHLTLVFEHGGDGVLQLVGVAEDEYLLSGELLPPVSVEGLLVDIPLFVSSGFSWALETQGIEMHPNRAAILGALAYLRVTYPERREP